MKHILKILWAIHSYILLPSILHTIRFDLEPCAGMAACAVPMYLPMELLGFLLGPSIVLLILTEWLYLTYIWSAVLLVGNVILLIKEKHANRSILVELLVFLVFLIFCVLGLLSSNEYVSGLMSV